MTAAEADSTAPRAEGHAAPGSGGASPRGALPPKRSDALSLLVVAAHLGFVLLPVYLAAALGPSLWLLALWLWFGLSMHGVLNLMHEASHFHVFHARAASDRLGHWILGPLVASDFDVYRQRHWDHHRFVGAENDTKDAYLLDVRGPREQLFFLRCVTLIEAVRKFTATRGVGTDATGAAARRATGNHWILRTALFQAVFLSSLVATAAAARGSLDAHALLAAGLAWGFVYLYALLSLTLWIASLRTLAEHGPGDDGGEVCGRATLRNLRCGPIGRLLMGCWGFADHATHHRFPALPSYHLPAETARLGEEGHEEFRARTDYLHRVRYATGR